MKDFLYEAIFIPEGVEPPAREIIEQPELKLYYEGFGTGRADYCIVADDDGNIVGAAWTRIMTEESQELLYSMTKSISILYELNVMTILEGQR